MRHPGAGALLLVAIGLPSHGAPAPGGPAQRNEARRVLLRAREAARMLDLEDRQVDLVGRIATAQVRAGDAGAALETVRSLLPRASRGGLLRDVAREQAQMGDVAGAKRTAASMQDDLAQMAAHVDIACAHARAGEPHRAFATVAAIASDQFTPLDRAEAFQRIAMAREKAGGREDARATLRRAFLLVRDSAPPSPEPPEVISLVRGLYALAIDQLATGDSSGAAATMEYLQALQGRHPELSAIPGLRVDAVRMMAATGDLEGAEAAAASMPRSEERDEAFRVIASRQARDHDIPGARVAASRIASRDARLEAFESIAGSQAKSKDVPGALETTALIAEPQDRALVLIKVASSLEGPVVLPAAAALTDAALDAAGGVTPRSLDPEFAFHLAEVQARLGDPAAGAITARRIRNDADRGRSLAAVLASQAALGDWRTAVDTAQREALPLVRSYALLGIAEGMLPRSSVCP